MMISMSAFCNFIEVNLFLQLFLVVPCKADFMGSAEVYEDLPKMKDIGIQTDYSEQHSEKSVPEAFMGSRKASGSIRGVLKKADWIDTCLMLLGTLGSIVDGMTLALLMLVLSSLMNGYGSAQLSIKDINKVRRPSTADAPALF